MNENQQNRPQYPAFLANKCGPTDFLVSGEKVDLGHDEVFYV